MESADSGMRGDRVDGNGQEDGTRDKAFSESALRVLITEARELLKEHDRLNPGRVDPPWIRLLRDLSAAVEHLLTEQAEMQQQIVAIIDSEQAFRRQAEAAEAQRDHLRGYAQHKSTCEVVVGTRSGESGNFEIWVRPGIHCTCGLSGLLTTEPR